MSGLLESLRQRQIVFSQRTDQDRRNQIWSLTTAGQRLLQLLLADLEMVPALVQQLDQRLESVPRLVRLLAEDPSAGDGQRPSQQEGRAA
jgi:DNA-binding MarR family transcriptional regulator